MTIEKLQSFCVSVRDSSWFERFIIGVIVLAGIVVGLETSVTVMERFHTLMHVLDRTILWIFVAEVIIKVGAEGRKPWRYFKSGWNIFDFSIVAVCFVPAAGSWVAVVRLARILRALRLITAVPRLQVLVAALLHSIPSMFYVSILLGLHFYVYAVMGTMFFRGNDPGHFGDLGLSLITLFRVVTLEDWTDVMYTAVYGSNVYHAQGAIPIGPDPHAFGIWAVLYFITFVVVGAMVMINLFIGVILSSMNDAKLEQREKPAEPTRLVDAIGEQAEIHHGIDRLEAEIKSLKETLKKLSEK
ncbi:MAG: ion transporter [Verrucomicrobiota bacterium]